MRERTLMAVPDAGRWRDDVQRSGLGLARSADGAAAGDGRPLVQLPFADRRAAGRDLALRLMGHVGEDLLVLGLPRGGVVVADEVARRLGAELDVFLVRKLGVPGREELAMGAVASGGVRVLNRTVIESLGVPWSVVEAATERAMREIEERERTYRDDRPVAPVAGRVVVVVDDGLATGATMRAVLSALRSMGPGRLVAAVPVAPPEVLPRLEREADEVVCLATPEPFEAVGLWYRDFTPVSAEEVRQLLRAAREGR
jgi:putative phosphoribosyl transferase